MQYNDNKDKGTLSKDAKGYQMAAPKRPIP